MTDQVTLPSSGVLGDWEAPLRSIVTVTATAGPDEPSLSLTRKPDGTGYDAVVRTSPNLRTTIAEEIQADPLLQTINPAGMGTPESIVTAYWSGLLNHMASPGEIPYLVPIPDIFDLNFRAGNLTQRMPGAYITTHAGLDTTAVGDMGLLTMTGNEACSAISSRTTGSRRSVDSSRIPDLAFLMPLTSYYYSPLNSLPWSPILIVECKCTSAVVTRRAGANGLAQLLSAMTKASIHRSCPYGLLCLGPDFTRVTVHSNEYIEIDISRIALQYLYGILGKALSPAPPYMITWEDFQRNETTIRNGYPSLNITQDSVSDLLRPDHINGLISLVQAATTSAHTSMISGRDIEVTGLPRMRQYVRLRITGVFVPPNSITISASSSMPSRVRPHLSSPEDESVDDGVPRQGGERGDTAFKRSKSGRDTNSAKGARDDSDIVDHEVPPVLEDSITARNLLAARDQKLIPESREGEGHWVIGHNTAFYYPYSE